MDVKEKIVELLGRVQQMGVIYRENQMDERYPTIEQIRNTEVAACLIANGVTVQEYGHWVPLTDCSNAGAYCSVCNKKVYIEDYDWCNRKNKLRSNYCPHCGANMMPQPQKGE